MLVKSGMWITSSRSYLLGCYFSCSFLILLLGIIIIIINSPHCVSISGLVLRLSLPLFSFLFLSCVVTLYPSYNMIMREECTTVPWLALIAFQLWWGSSLDILGWCCCCCYFCCYCCFIFCPSIILLIIPCIMNSFATAAATNIAACETNEGRRGWNNWTNNGHPVMSRDNGIIVRFVAAVRESSNSAVEVEWWPLKWGIKF